MNFIYDIIPEEFIKAIGWTIFHSVWQGAVVAILLAGILLLTHKKNSRLRYNLSAAALFIMFGISIITFIYVYTSSAEISSGSVETFYGSSLNSTTDINSEPLGSNTDLDIPGTLKSYFAQHMPLIVTVWLFGFFLFSLRFVGGLLYVQKLKNNGVNPVDDSWTYSLRELSKKLVLNKIVQIFESAKVKTPITIGYLKPIILLPIGMITGLPQDQVEAIIIHELVHIKRYDFLVNLFQTFIETILFYHPVVWWISSTIKSERENCCDDLTLKLCGGSLIYFKALYNLQQIYSNENDLALAAIGKKNQLFRRINRMNSNNRNSSYGIKFAAFAVLLILIAAALFYSTSSAKENRYNTASIAFVNPNILSSDNISSDQSGDRLVTTADTLSLKKGKRTLKFSEDDKRYKAKLNNGKIEEFYVDGDKVDEKDLPKYEGMVNQHLDEYDSAMNEYRESMKDYKEKMKTFREKMKKFRGTHSFNFDGDFDFPIPPTSIEIPEMDTTEWKRIMKNVPQVELDSMRAELKNFHFDNEAFKESMKEWKKNMKNYKFDEEAFQKSMSEWKEKVKDFKFNDEAFKESMSKWSENMKNFKLDMEKFNGEMKKNGPGSEAFKKSMEELKVNMGNLKVEMKKLKDFIHDTKDELVKDKLMDEGDDLDNFTLSKDEMIVGGKKVSQGLHKKYLELYKKHFGKELTGEKKFRIND